MSALLVIGAGVGLALLAGCSSEAPPVVDSSWSERMTALLGGGAGDGGGAGGGGELASGTVSHPSQAAVTLGHRLRIHPPIAGHLLERRYEVHRLFDLRCCPLAGLCRGARLVPGTDHLFAIIGTRGPGVRARALVEAHSD